MQQTSSNKVTTYVMYTLITVAAVFLFFRYLYRPILPFFCAWVIASLLQSPVRTLVRRTGWDRRFFSVILVLVFTGLFVALLFSLFNSVIVFARSLLHFLGENMEQLSRFFSERLAWLRDLVDDFPFWRGGEEGSVADEVLTAFDTFFSNMLHQLTETLSAKIPTWIASAAAQIPSILLFFLITLLAAVYICCDYDKLRGVWRRILPKGVLQFCVVCKKQSAKTFKQYFRAYAILLALTFGELLVGFLLLGVPNPAGIALLVALVDILPVLGVGTVLIPWSLFELCIGKLPFGIGMIVLYLVVVIVRQILEPRIVGSSIGLHPLLTLFAMYVGLRLCGVLGLIFFPVLLTIAKELFFAYRQTKTSPEETNDQTRKTAYRQTH